MRRFHYNTKRFLTVIILCFSLLLNGCGNNSSKENVNPDYYYSQLNDFDKLLYDYYLEQYEHTNEDGYTTTFTISFEKYADFCNDKDFVQYCLYYDHPEYYQHENNLDWTIDTKIENTDDGYKVTLSQTINLPNYEEEQKEIAAAAEKYLSDIDLDDKEYNIALKIHDKLIEDFNYVGGDNMDVDNIRYSQTIYGILVGKNGEKTGVCEAKADTYIYLLKKAGILCAPVLGGNGNAESFNEAYEYACSHEGRHEWVIAFLDGKWYEIDPTWDSFDENKYPDPYKTAMKEDEAYLNKRHHKFWAKTTEEMKCVQRYYFNYDGQDYSYEPVYTAYVRATDENWYGKDEEKNMNRFIRAAELTPIAE